MIHFKPRIFVALVLLASASCSYLPDEQDPLEGVEMREERSHFVLSPRNKALVKKTGIVFYPGGLVDPRAYIKAMSELVQLDNRVVIVLKATSNLSIMNPNLARRVLEDEQNLPESWLLAGHSLGGVVAAMAVNKNPENYKGLVMLAAYSSVDLSAWRQPMMIVTGSRDEVFDSADIEKNKANMPPLMQIEQIEDMPTSGSIGQTILWQIEGANHGQFGDYGAQKGDGTASISPEQQHKLVAEGIVYFLLSNGIE